MPQANLSPPESQLLRSERRHSPASWNGLPVWKHRAGSTRGPGKGPGRGAAGSRITPSGPPVPSPHCHLGTPGRNVVCACFLGADRWRQGHPLYSPAAHPLPWKKVFALCLKKIFFNRIDLFLNQEIDTESEALKNSCFPRIV